MVQILAQNIGQDMALVGGGVAVTLAGLLIKRGFQLCVGGGNGNGKERPGVCPAHEGLVQLVHELHEDARQARQETNASLRLLHGRMDEVLSILAGKKK